MRILLSCSYCDNSAEPIWASHGETFHAVKRDGTAFSLRCEKCGRTRPATAQQVGVIYGAARSRGHRLHARAAYTHLAQRALLCIILGQQPQTEGALA